MSSNIHFQIQRGSVVSDCMEETYQFISQNLSYLHDTLIPLRDELLESSEFTFICYEENWSFASKVERVELGRVSSGHGLIQEGSQCAYDELLESLD